jgi:outer membrane immunogenic protein
MNRILSAIVVFATFAFVPLLSNAADTPDATLDISGSRVAVGVGIVQASGTLHFQGQNYRVRVQGLTVGEVGGGTITATGEVYNLSNLNDLSGNYVAVSAGATLGGGSGGAAMQNQNGVVIKLRATTQGADLNFSIDGFALKLTRKSSLDKQAEPALANAGAAIGKAFKAAKSAGEQTNPENRIVGCAGGMDATGNDCM